MVRGMTFEQREAARQERTRKNRLTHFIAAIRDARTGRQRLQQACQFAKAVGDDLGDEDRTEMAREIAEIADRRNRQREGRRGQPGPAGAYGTG